MQFVYILFSKFKLQSTEQLDLVARTGNVHIFISVTIDRCVELVIEQL